MIGLLLATALAQAADARICAWYQLTFADNHDPDRGVVVGDDFFADIGAEVPGFRPARGALIRAVRSDGGEVVDEAFAAWNGVEAGCAELSLGDERYDVQILSVAEVNGSRIAVRDPEDDGLWVGTLLDDWRPPAELPARIDRATALHPSWQMASVLGWALKRRSAGLRGVVVAYPTSCRRPDHVEQDGGCAWVDETPDGPRMVVYNDRPDWKYRTAHELGHALQMLAAGPARFERGADPGACFSQRPDGAAWEHNSEEYASLAAVEGFAEFYAALVFNRSVRERDCWLHTRNPVDWDLDGAMDTPFPSCHASPYGEARSGVDAADYHGDLCGGAPNRSTVYDHVRFYWSLTASEAVSLARLLQVWVGADPGTWTPDDAGPEVSAAPTRLQWAADAVGLGAAWREWAAVHGTDR